MTVGLRVGKVALLLVSSVVAGRGVNPRLLAPPLEHGLVT
jgi:hypothetical protein